MGGAYKLKKKAALGIYLKTQDGKGERNM